MARRTNDGAVAVLDTLEVLEVEGVALDGIYTVLEPETDAVLAHDTDAVALACSTLARVALDALRGGDLERVARLLDGIDAVAVETHTVAGCHGLVPEADGGTECYVGSARVNVERGSAPVPSSVWETAVARGLAFDTTDTLDTRAVKRTRERANARHGTSRMRSGGGAAPQAVRKSGGVSATSGTHAAAHASPSAPYT